MSRQLDAIPVQDPTIVTEFLDGELVLYHPQRTAAIYLNPTAGLIWGLCDGNRSVAEIVETLASNYPDAGGNLASEVMDAVEGLRRQGALT